MRFDMLRPGNLDALMTLFCKSFANDSYYASLFPNPATRAADMAEAFRDVLAYCLRQGSCLGLWKEQNLVAFLICFDYRKTQTKDSAMFRTIFAGKSSAPTLPYAELLHGAVSQLPGTILFCLSIAVDPALRRQGIASALWDRMLTSFPHCSFASDISNTGSLALYRRREFQITPLDTVYFLISRPADAPTPTLSIGQTVDLVVPDTVFLDINGISYRILKGKSAVSMARRGTSMGLEMFLPDADALCFGARIRMAYDQFLRYQRAINLSHYRENLRADYLYYTMHTPYRYFPLKNETMEQMLQTRATEWAVIPDIFISVPVQYDPTTFARLPEPKPQGNIRHLLRDLDFRTHYEAGIPATSPRVDDLASFKQRIQRKYLGKIALQISSENTAQQYDVIGDPIGAPISVDLFLSVDKNSSCGVLSWYTLSAPFLISQLLDNVIRNQVLVVTENQSLNFFDYMSRHYGLVRRGTPKSFLMIPQAKSCLQDGQIASLLASETIYPDGEAYGELIDPEITAIVQSPLGMGQYDRAYVAAYTNVVLQFAPDSWLSVRERIGEGAILLFYMELILFEEAAIHIADREIVKLFTTTPIEDPIDFLQHVERIHNEYSSTIDFWDIHVNYPTSQKSIHMLRSAFRLKEQLECMQRNQEQLRTVFDTKCDIIDRKDARRMDTSLAILSILAVFSAWIDGHDYLSTWDDLLSGDIIHLLQKILFLLVLVTAIFAVTHLFGGRTAMLIRLHRAKRKLKAKRKRK